MRRRAVLGAGLGTGLAAQAMAAGGPADVAAEVAGMPWADLPGGWVGASHARGHRLRQARSGSWPVPAVQRRAAVLVVGGGIAGLAALHALAQAGIADAQLLELEDQAGGNARGHVMAGQRCPLGAHYLPVPGEPAHEVRDWLQQIGLLRMVAGRLVPDERHLCHSPQERLFVDGGWVDGLLPQVSPGAAGANTLRQYRAFAAQVDNAQRQLGFAIPSHRAPWTAAHAALDNLTMDAWLTQQGLDDARLRWYLDYCCRDDYGAGLATVSAWAGLHYFASRHGFHAPGDDSGEREPVFTWDEGNAWLAGRLAQPLQAQLQPARTVLRVSEGRHDVHVLAWDESRQQAEAWTAQAVVLATPLFISARLLDAPPPALRQAAAQGRYAPWLVANLQLRAPLLDRGIGAPAAWDNVRYGSPSLGYVDATHQRLSPLPPSPVVLTAYWALPEAQRAALLADDWRAWARQVVADLAAVHPDLPAKLQRIDLMRYGHAMSIPVPGRRGDPALAALQTGNGRVQFAHSDLAAYSVFEEAFVQGRRAAAAVAARLRPAQRAV